MLFRSLLKASTKLHSNCHRTSCLSRSLHTTYDTNNLSISLLANRNNQQGEVIPCDLMDSVNRMHITPTHLYVVPRSDGLLYILVRLSSYDKHASCDPGVLLQTNQSEKETPTNRSEKEKKTVTHAQLQSRGRLADKHLRRARPVPVVPLLPQDRRRRKIPALRRGRAAKAPSLASRRFPSGSPNSRTFLTFDFGNSVSAFLV